MSIIGSTLLEITEQQNDQIIRNFKECFGDYVRRLRCIYLEQDIEELKRDLADDGEIIVYFKKGIKDKVKVIA